MATTTIICGYSLHSYVYECSWDWRRKRRLSTRYSLRTNRVWKQFVKAVFSWSLKCCLRDFWEVRLEFWRFWTHLSWAPALRLRTAGGGRARWLTARLKKLARSFEISQPASAWIGRLLTAGLDNCLLQIIHKPPPTEFPVSLRWLYIWICGKIREEQGNL